MKLLMLGYLKVSGVQTVDGQNRDNGDWSIFQLENPLSVAYELSLPSNL